MIVSDARQAAVRWVRESASALPGFRGAFFHGSIIGKPEGDPFPSTSDVDVGVALAVPPALPRLGKQHHDGALVEGAAIAMERLATAEQALGDYRLASSFATDGIIADPTGHLRTLQKTVGRRFGKRRWLVARCQDARSNCLRYVRGLEDAASYPTKAIYWLFAEGNLCHVLLAAGRKNPTVRRRYSAVRELLETHGRLDLHETLLTMLGCAEMQRRRVEEHLSHMTEAFDQAASTIRSEFPFGSDLSVTARPIAIEGTRQLIEVGEHREAIFWIVATYARSLAVLEADGPPRLGAALEPGFRALLRDLGVESYEAMERRVREIEQLLPDLMSCARELALIHASPA